MILVVDFDGVLSLSGFPHCGKFDYDLIRAFIKAQQRGHVVILNTCREGMMLEAAVTSLLHFNFRPDFVNQNKPVVFYDNCRKVYGDFYYDDHSFNWDAVAALRHVESLGDASKHASRRPENLTQAD